MPTTLHHAPVAPGGSLASLRRLAARWIDAYVAWAERLGTRHARSRSVPYV